MPLNRTLYVEPALGRLLFYAHLTLTPYEYLKHLLTEIPKHMDDADSSFLEELLPWSDAILDVCRKTNG